MAASRVYHFIGGPLNGEDRSLPIPAAHYYDIRRLPPSPPGSYRQARGAAPWQPGMPTPEEAIRRIRDGVDSDDH